MFFVTISGYFAARLDGHTRIFLYITTTIHIHCILLFGYKALVYQGKIDNTQKQITWILFWKHAITPI